MPQAMAHPPTALAHVITFSIETRDMLGATRSRSAKCVP